LTSLPPSPFEHPGPPPLRPELPEGAPPPPEPVAASDPGPPPLGVPWWAPFVALVAALAGVLVADLVLGIGLALGGEDVDPRNPPPGVTITLTAVLFALLIVVAWWSVKLATGRARPAAFGLRPTAPLPALGWTLLAYVGFLALSFTVLQIFGREDQQLVQDIEEEDAVGLLVAYGLLSCIAAPIAEEFFFRGFMFRALAGRVHVLLAALVAGSVFGLSHAAGSPATALLVLSGFGIALCLLLYRTGSLVPCIMLHAFNNSVAFGSTKDLPWWGFLLLVVGSVGTTFLVSLLVLRRSSRSPPPQLPLQPPQTS
jgi:uncharacterized protein